LENILPPAVEPINPNKTKRTAAAEEGEQNIIRREYFRSLEMKPNDGKKRRQLIEKGRFALFFELAERKQETGERET
jgi:hypothetical protein